MFRHPGRHPDGLRNDRFGGHGQGTGRLQAGAGQEAGDRSDHQRRPPGRRRQRLQLGDQRDHQGRGPSRGKQAAQAAHRGVRSEGDRIRATHPQHPGCPRQLAELLPEQQAGSGAAAPDDRHPG